MEREGETEVGRLIDRLGTGAEELTPQAFERVYDALRTIARRQLAGERRGHTLQPTALVHEAFLRLSGRRDLDGVDVGTFFQAAAEAMRRILVDHARRRGRQKRGGDWQRVPYRAVDLVRTGDLTRILAIDEAVRRLEKVDADAARVVRLRFFAGLEIQETAEALGCSPRSVTRDWSFARAWLYRALGEADG